MKKPKQTPKALDAPHAFELPDGQHYIGGGDGFNKHGDTVTPSPNRQEWMARIWAQQQGVNDLLDVVNAFAAKRFAELNADRDRFWVAMREDLGLTDKPEGERLTYHNGRITLRPEEPPKK